MPEARTGRKPASFPAARGASGRPAVGRGPAAGRPEFARWLRDANDVTGQFLAHGADPDRINLAGGLPDPALYPIEAIGEAIGRALERHGRRALNYGPVQGLPELRELIAARLRAKGVSAGVENVLVTSGSMQALDLLGKALIEPGDTIAVQTPTYLGALDAWRPREPRFRKLDVAAGDAGASRNLAGAKFAYVKPNFSNPTGALIGRDMRGAILDAAHEANVWLVEDDPYDGLYFDGPPLPSVLQLDGARSPGRPYAGPVVYLGSLSKSLAPGLRIGWTVASPEMIDALALAKQGTDLSSSAVCQIAALEILGSDLVERHLPGLNALYRNRRDAICAAAQEHLAEWFEWSRPEGGMFLWLTGRGGAVDTDRLLPRAVEAGVLFSPSSAFDPDGRMKHGMRLNFTLNDEAALRRGVERLAGAVRQHLSEKT